MATIFTFLTLVVAIVLPTWLALGLASSFVGHTTISSGTPVAWRWAQFGGGGLIIPSFGVAFYYGAPYCAGALSSWFGETGLWLGAILGFFITLFFGVFIGALVGASLSKLRRRGNGAC